MLPSKYKNMFFFAEHGSWNRKDPSGYRIMVSDVSRSPPTYDVFASGFVEGAKIYGRPVDIEVMPDGSLMVSDDHANKIYRISYHV